jgi:sulfite exporter TauE/SafE
MSPLPPAYAHVLGLGIIWTSMHCAAMCGPLLCGLQIGGARPDHRTRAGRRILGVLTYQAGRGLTYAWLGGLAGLVGSGLGHVFTSAGGVLSLLFGGALILSVMRPKNSPVRLRRRPQASIATTTISRIRALVSPLLSSTHPLRDLALGAMMGFLPCMIPAWALGQAAVTGSPFHGAVIMLLLVLLTTPVLLVTTQLPRLGSLLPRRLRTGVMHCLPAVSGCWLLLIGGAGLGLWPHEHLGITILGHPFLMMIF